MKPARWWMLGEKNVNNVLHRSAVRRIRILHGKGWSFTELGKRFGVRHQTVAAIVSGETWGWLT